MPYDHSVLGTIGQVPAKTRPSAKLHILTAPNLSRQRWLLHGFSTRPGGHSKPYGGALNLGYTRHDARRAVERNRALFLKALGVPRWQLVTARQIHSDHIRLVEHAPEHPLPGDGLITATPGLLLAVQAADCLPVLLADPRRRAVGAFHAGWRGTVKRLVEKGVGAMRQAFGSRPQDLVAAIGPGIGPCCYAVGDEVRDQFHSQFAYAADLFHEVEVPDPVREKYPLLFLTARAPGHGPVGKELHLDLGRALRRQLLDAGVPARNLSALARCTACDTRTFFSHRAEKGLTGRMMAVIGIR